jgi:Fuc2NAc and GlcNAc transferase
VEVLLVIAAAFCGYVGALLVRRNAVRLGLLQHPNERSSHAVPTPGGGGIGIVIGGSLGAVPLVLSEPHFAWLLLAGLAIALLGLADDRWPLPALLRLPLQLACAGAAVLGLVGTGGWLVAIVATLAIGLWLNLFNFVDGIDGIAGSEAAFLLLAGLALMGLDHPSLLLSGPGLWMLAVAAATLGFLVLNWPPAKVFMGDGGSTYLGLMLGLFALWTHDGGGPTYWQWIILAAAFLADGLTTLGRRALRGEKVWRPHRRHAYQVLARRFGGHLPVTLLYSAINIALLLPLAALAGAFPDAAPWIATATLALLGLAAAMAGAGRAED